MKIHYEKVGAIVMNCRKDGAHDRFHSHTYKVLQGMLHTDIKEVGSYLFYRDSNFTGLFFDFKINFKTIQGVILNDANGPELVYLILTNTIC